MKKKIIIFTSTGGGGHLSVSHALEEVLKAEYEVKSVLALGDIVKAVDPMQQLTFGYIKGEDTYNYLLKRQWSRTLSTAMHATLAYFKLRKRKIRKTILDYLQTEKPDIVVSVFHLFNNYLIDVTRELNIPFLLIPTDLDATQFLYGIHNPQYDKFKIALAFDTAEIVERIKQHQISANNVAFTGFPVKKTFSNHCQTDNNNVRDTFAISQDKKIIMVLMGAQGSHALYAFARELTQLTYPAHILFCLGRHESVRGKIEKLRFHPLVSITCIGFTHLIPELMKTADLIVTKSGSVSVCEAIYAQLPMILDGTNTILNWEAFNHSLIERYGFGKSLRIKTELCSLIQEWLEKDFLGHFKEKLKDFDKKEGLAEIKKVIQQMAG